ncbi:MAG: type II toxin-antitoxin system RelB/DinJ family antitoxin [Ruthenibacterium sp.]
MEQEMIFDIEIDSELKAQAECLFAQMGLTLAQTVELFIRETAEQGKIPFSMDGI